MIHSDNWNTHTHTHTTTTTTTTTTHTHTHTNNKSVHVYIQTHPTIAVIITSNISKGKSYSQHAIRSNGRAIYMVKIEYNLQRYRQQQSLRQRQSFKFSFGTGVLLENTWIKKKKMWKNLTICGSLFQTVWAWFKKRIFVQIHVFWKKGFWMVWNQEQNKTDKKWCRRLTDQTQILGCAIIQQRYTRSKACGLFFGS